MSHQSDWIYYKQPIKFLVVKVNDMWEVLIPTQFRSAMHIYSSIKDEKVFIYWAQPNIWMRLRLRILWAGLIIICNWIISQRNIVFGISLRACDERWAFRIRWVFELGLLLGLRCEWKTSWCGFYDRINCILGGRNALLGMWTGCDQVQIVCVLSWNLNIAAEFVMSVPGVPLISASIDKFRCEKRRDYD